MGASAVCAANKFTTMKDDNFDDYFDESDAPAAVSQPEPKSAAAPAADGSKHVDFTDDIADDEAKAAKDAEQAKSVREKRNKKLSETDWTQLADSTADKEKFATYRQALRDVPTQAGFPWDISWPEA